MKLMKDNSIDRANYLSAAYDLIGSQLIKKAPKRSKVALAFSFPTRGATTAKVIGQCHQLTDKKAKEKHLIVVHPVVWKGGAIEVLHVLAHEMAHASLPPKTGHKKPFAELVESIGLEGKPTHTTPGPKFRSWCAKSKSKLPKFPAAISLAFKVKKQTTRLRLFECKCEAPIKLRVGRDELNVKCLDCNKTFKRVDT